MKRISLLLLVLVCLVHSTIASSETVFTQLGYDDVPTAIREAANSEFTKLIHDSGTVDVLERAFSDEFIQNFNLSENTETTQSQIFVDDLQSYIWNIVYFAKGTPQFIGAVLLDFDGKVLLRYAGWDPGFVKILETKVGRSFYDWTLEEQHVFDELFLRNSYSDSKWHHSLPKADDLPPDTLITIGKNYLFEYYHVPQEKIESYAIQYLYITGAEYPGDLGKQEGKAVLRFVNPKSPRAYEYQVTLSAENGSIYFSTPFPDNP